MEQQVLKNDWSKPVVLHSIDELDDIHFAFQDATFHHIKSGKSYRVLGVTFSKRQGEDGNVNIQYLRKGDPIWKKYDRPLHEFMQSFKPKSRINIRHGNE